MNKLRMDYFLSVCGKFANGDVYTDSQGNSMTIGRDECGGCVSVSNANLPIGSDDERFIESFAPRKNEGVMPCNAEIPVFISGFTDGADADGFGLAGDFVWERTFSLRVDFWHPNINALIEMQNQHDKEQQESKPKTIMDALNWFKGDVENAKDDSCCSCNVIVEAKFDFDGVKKGDLACCVYTPLLNNEYWKKVCTLEELKSLIDELSQLMQEPLVYTQAMADAGVGIKYGMKYLDEDGQLCECFGVLGSVVFGHLYEHPPHGDCLPFSQSHLSECKAFDTRTKKEKVIDGIIDLVNIVVDDCGCTNTLAETIYNKYIEVAK